MDILKKMFQPKSKEGQDASATNKDEFRKPQWFEEPETDDELFDDDRKFAFQVFTNPLELQRHFERQMQRMLESLNDLDDDSVVLEKDLKEDFLRPGFESKLLKEFEKQQRGFIDTDLDGEIYGDQLHSLLQCLNPDERKQLPSSNEEPGNILPANKKSTRSFLVKPKLTDEETIMGRIHGTIGTDGNLSTAVARLPLNRRSDVMTPMMPHSGMSQFGGVFDGGYQGPKMFSQSVMTKTIRKPDGSYETTKITQDSSGKKTTTVTRMVDGKNEIISTNDDFGEGKGGTNGGVMRLKTDEQLAQGSPNADRNLYVTKEGYALPRNLW